MPKINDLTGQKFGRLTVIERAENKGKGTYWRCKCECGNEKNVRSSHLTEGKICSCGCLAIERRTKHTMSKTRFYKAWSAIKQRCFNPKSSEYRNYGGRGITICDEWLDFQNFYNYVSQLEHFGVEGYTLDRIDVNGNYEPNNVRWIKRNMQARNMRKSVFVDYYGVKMLLVDVVKITGIKYETLKGRISSGWSGDKLFSPVKKNLPKSDLVLVKYELALTSSLKVAEVFEKRHDHVMRDIRKLIDDLKKIGVSPNLGTPPEDKAVSVSAATPIFIESNYVNSQNKQVYPMYLMNRNALTLLAMNFDGLKALQFKLKYIAEFNRMETALKGNPPSRKNCRSLTW